jgi:hypothetical protein
VRVLVLLLGGAVAVVAVVLLGRIGAVIPGLLLAWVVWLASKALDRSTRRPPPNKDL